MTVNCDCKVKALAAGASRTPNNLSISGGCGNSLSQRCNSGRCTICPRKAKQVARDGGGVARDDCSHTPLTKRSASIVAALAQQHLTLTHMVGGADDTFRFHLFHQSGSAVVADLQLALNEGSRRTTVPRHNLHRLAIELRVGAFIPASKSRQVFLLTLRLIGQAFDKGRLTLRLQVCHDSFHFLEIGRASCRERVWSAEVAVCVRQRAQ